MRSHRFYSPVPLIEGQLVQLPTETAHHCTQVLRYRKGATLTLFNGDGFEYVATIQNIVGKSCEVLIDERRQPDNESPLNLHLLQGIARGEKMDLIIQKAVELGVSEITPIFSERCNVKLDHKRLEKKQQHWQKIAISASEQSGRVVIPAINPARHLNKLLSDEKQTHIYLEPTAPRKLKDFSLLENVCIYIGPEGGFSTSDLKYLESIGVIGLQLGPRVLRTETAGLATIAILQSHFGDI